MTKSKNRGRDFALGATGEDKVISLFNESGLASVRAASGRFDKYDIVSVHLGESFTTEVKFDAYAARSGNIAIEIFNPKSGKPSGLMATQADLWVHITSEIHVANVTSLKKWLDDNKPHKIIPSGGDDNATLYLYRKDTILVEPLFTRIDHLSKEDRAKIVLSYLV